MKRKLLALISTLLVLCTMLVSCGSVSSVGKVLNKKYDLSPDIYKSAVDLSELEDYYYSRSSEEFALFYKSEGTDMTYKVLSMRGGSIVGTFTTSENTFYGIDFIGYTPAFLVSKAVVDTDAIDKIADADKKTAVSDIVASLVGGELSIDDALDSALEAFVDTTYTLYDATGAEVASSTKVNDARQYADMVIFDCVAYDINEKKGTLSKAATIPEYMNIGSCDFYDDEHFYIVDDNRLTVYDRSFNLCFTYVAPYHGDESIQGDVYNFNLLNNGDVLLQYTVTLDEDAKRYDMIYIEDDVSYKTDLVSKLISVKSGKAKDINLDYIVSTILTNKDLYDENKSEEKNRFNDKFDNIAIICPIENRKLMLSDADIDIVLMNNDARAKKSLKMVDGQTADIATKIGEDKYLVKTLDGGSVIIKAGGKVLNVMNQSLELCGSYFIGTRAIYNRDLSVAYDLYENDAEVYLTLNTAVLLKKTTDVGYDIIKLIDGKEPETVYSHNDSESKTEFLAEDGDNFYVIKTSESEYSYYNEKGESILVSKTMLSEIAISYTHTSLLMMSTDGRNYCLLTK